MSGNGVETVVTPMPGGGAIVLGIFKKDGKVIAEVRTGVSTTDEEIIQQAKKVVGKAAKELALIYKNFGQL